MANLKMYAATFAVWINERLLGEVSAINLVKKLNSTQLIITSAVPASGIELDEILNGDIPEECSIMIWYGSPDTNFLVKLSKSCDKIHHPTILGPGNTVEYLGKLIETKLSGSCDKGMYHIATFDLAEKLECTVCNPSVELPTQMATRKDSLSEARY